MTRGDRHAAAGLLSSGQAPHVGRVVGWVAARVLRPPNEVSVWRACTVARSLRAQRRRPEAVAAYQKAVEGAAIVFGEHAPQTAVVRSALAVVLLELADFARAVPLLRTSLSDLVGVLGDAAPLVTANRAHLGLALVLAGKTAEDLPQVEEGLSFADAAMAQLPDAGEPRGCLTSNAKFEVLTAWDEAARVLMAAQPDVARTLLTRALQLAEELLNTADQADVRRRLVSVAEQLASHLATNNAKAEAERLYRRALAIAQQVESSDAATSKDRRNVAALMTKLADVLTDTGRFKDAADLYRRGLDAQQQFLNDAENGVGQRQSLAAMYQRVGVVATQVGMMDEAAEMLQRGLVVAEGLVDASPEREDFQRGSLKALMNAARLPGDDTPPHQTLAWARRALEIAEVLVVRHPHDKLCQRDLAAAIYCLGVVTADAGDVTAAEALHRRAIGVLEALSSSDGEDADVRRTMAACWVKLGDCAVKLRRREEAADWHHKALLAREQLLAINPGDIEAARDLADSCERLAALRRAEDRSQADVLLDRAVELRRLAHNAAPDRVDTTMELALALHRLWKHHPHQQPQPRRLADEERVRELLAPLERQGRLSAAGHEALAWARVEEGAGA